MEEKYKLYDSINTTAMRWLASLSNEHMAAFICNGSTDNEVFYILTIARHLNSLYGCKFYINSSLKAYLYLKYIKKFYYLRRTSKKIIYFEIKPKDFIKEVQDYFGIGYNIIEQIYEEYYKRR